MAGDGGSEGAAYAPPGVIVPQAVLVQPVPVMLQAIARLGLEFAAGVKVAVKVAELPALTDDGPLTARENVLVMVTVPVPLFEGSATLIAVRVMFGGAVRICGAVNVPEEFTVPHAAPAHPLPDSTHVTVRLGFPAEFTVAANGLDAPSSTGIEAGETETETSLVIVTRDVAVFEPSAALVASTATPVGWGKFAGAVYCPLASIVPTVELPPGTPLTLHVTAVLEVLLTVAVNPWDVPSNTDAEGGATVTVIPEGGGCDGPDPATPPQPRKNATRISAGHHSAGVRDRLERPRSFLMSSIAPPFARDVPVRCSSKVGD